MIFTIYFWGKLHGMKNQLKTVPEMVPVKTLL